MSLDQLDIRTASSDGPSSGWTSLRLATLVGGPAIGAALWFLFRPHAGVPGAFSESGSIVLGLLAWMAIWWACQSVELAITALLPVIVLPFTGAVPADKVLTPYANDLIFLFAGGSVIGLAIERHGLGQRLLQLVLARVGRSPGRAIASFLVVSASVSAWVSNTATTLMMLPLAMAAIALYSRGVDRSGPLGKPLRNFETSILLAVAYGATIGGVITLLGSAPNPIAAEWIRGNGGSISFLRWSMIGLPCAILMMIAAQLLFRRLLPVRGLPSPPDDDPSTGAAPLSRAAWVTLLVFGLAVAAWIASPFLKSAAPALVLRDGMIGIAAAMLLLTLPARGGSATPIVPWNLVDRLPWGVFILFGGGMSLSEAMQSTGVSAAIAQSVGGISTLPSIAIIAIIVAILAFASEIASNTALTATAVPIVGALAPGLGIPADKLVVAAALGASLAFMLPVGTPPSALVYATGKIKVRDMMRLGFALNLASIVVVTIVCGLLM
ncbi:MAG: SLC13/DASS family transporter [Phycisphaerales bacterium]|nr:SLC13/DASS family transporter [Phycisphaerales bacterium]